jgi:hypothetical protein
VIATVPDNRGYIAKSIVVTITTASATGFPLMAVYPNASCAGSEGLAVAPTDRTGVFTFPLEPGFGLAHGNKLGARVFNVSSVAVAVFG